ncbi:hypothetical protein, partial [Kitasatospora purpeofusca]|uniref:hypothetical protein n=1 Tax=Kitasatospora purpeofusca TaxID=67352 RepID=UPI0005641278
MLKRWEAMVTATTWRYTYLTLRPGHLRNLGCGTPARDALFEDLGPLPADNAERLDVYRLYRAIELWTGSALDRHPRPLAASSTTLPSWRTNAPQRRRAPGQAQPTQP